MLVKPFLIVVALSAICLPAVAQQQQGDTVFKGSTIEVIQAYKPQVKKAPKPEWIPQLPVADTSHPVFNFEVPQQTLYYSYSSEPIKPLTLGKVNRATPYPNYVKAGVGNLSTLNLEAGIGNLVGEQFETGIHLYHLSQKGNIKYQQTSQTSLDAQGTIHSTLTELHAGIAISHETYNYFGYDHGLYDYNKDSVKQHYTTIRPVIEIANTKAFRDIYCRPQVMASLYSAAYSTTETSFGLNLPFKKVLDSNIDLEIAVSAQVTKFKRSGFTASNNVVAVTPGIVLHNNNVTGRGHLGFASGKNGDFYILPEIEASFVLPNNKLTFQAGWLASLRRNTYEELTIENPWLDNQLYLVKQSRRDEIFGSISGNKWKRFSYTAKLNWIGFQNMATYLNAGADYRKFAVAYYDMSAIGIGGSARYTISGNWSAGLNATYYSYSVSKGSHAWGQPSLTVKGDVSVAPAPKLVVNGYLSLLDGIYAINKTGGAVVLPIIVDVGGNAEYTITRRLNAFVTIDNLLNNRYQRWQGYDAYGINVYGGIRLKF